MSLLNITTTNGVKWQATIAHPKHADRPRLAVGSREPGIRAAFAVLIDSDQAFVIQNSTEVCHLHVGSAVLECNAIQLPLLRDLVEQLEAAQAKADRGEAA